MSAPKILRAQRSRSSMTVKTAGTYPCGARTHRGYSGEKARWREHRKKPGAAPRDEHGPGTKETARGMNVDSIGNTCSHAAIRPEFAAGRRPAGAAQPMESCLTSPEILPPLHCVDSSGGRRQRVRSALL